MKTLQQLEQEHAEALLKARETSVISSDHIIAWALVEELAAAINDRKSNNPEVEGLEAYCATDPSAPECKEFDV